MTGEEPSGPLSTPTAWELPNTSRNKTPGTVSSAPCGGPQCALDTAPEPYAEPTASQLAIAKVPECGVFASPSIRDAPAWFWQPQYVLSASARLNRRATSRRRVWRSTRGCGRYVSRGRVADRASRSTVCCQHPVRQSVRRNQSKRSSARGLSPRVRKQRLRNCRARFAAQTPPRGLTRPPAERPPTEFRVKGRRTPHHRIARPDQWASTHAVSLPAPAIAGIRRPSGVRVDH